MCEAFEPSSSSYMVIKYMKIIGIPIPLDSLTCLHWAVVITGDPSWVDTGLVFSWTTIYSGETIFEAFSSASWPFVSAGVILEGFSSNNVPLFHAFVTSVDLVSSLTLMASRDMCYIVSTYSSMVISLNLVILGLSLLWRTSSQSWVPLVKISSLNLWWAYGQHEDTCDAC